MSGLSYTDEERELAATARSFLTSFVDNGYLNAQSETERGYEAGCWQRICELGWTGVHLPGRVGGSDGSLVDAALICREVGRAAFASPLLQTLRAGTVLTTLRSDKQHDDLLAAMVQGTPAVLLSPPDRTLVGELADGALRLRGGACLVEWYAASESVVLLVPGSDGAWWCAVVPRPMLDRYATDVASIDNERVSRLELDGLTVPGDVVRAASVSSRSARYALARADLLRASAMVGGAQEVVERTARYALERHQFGQPIGGFQAVRHHLARMVIAADGAELLCDDALHRAETDADERAIAAAALFAAGRSYTEVVLTAAQIFGGVGTTVEHVLHHHFRRAKAMQLRSGRRANRLRELHQSLVVERAARPSSLW
jgi:alkylation response protein AidB-like acyl-CoA dehydrogenase